MTVSAKGFVLPGSRGPQEPATIRFAISSDRVPSVLIYADAQLASDEPIIKVLLRDLIRAVESLKEEGKEALWTETVKEQNHAK